MGILHRTFDKKVLEQYMVHNTLAVECAVTEKEKKPGEIRHDMVHDLIRLQKQFVSRKEPA
jgi:hypothetical protein